MHLRYDTIKLMKYKKYTIVVVVAIVILIVTIVVVEKRKTQKTPLLPEPPRAVSINTFPPVEPEKISPLFTKRIAYIEKATVESITPQKISFKNSAGVSDTFSVSSSSLVVTPKGQKDITVLKTGDVVSVYLEQISNQYQVTQINILTAQ